MTAYILSSENSLALPINVVRGYWTYFRMRHNTRKPDVIREVIETPFSITTLGGVLVVGSVLKIRMN